MSAASRRAASGASGLVSFVFRAAKSALVSGLGVLESEAPVAPPGDDRLVGDVGLAEHGRVGAEVEADGDRVLVVEDDAVGFEEASLEGLGGGGVVAGEAAAER